MKVVLACYVIHNHVMEVESNDHIMEAAMNQIECSLGEPKTRSCQDFAEESKVWNVNRDEICQAMWSDYTRSRE